MSSPGETLRAQGKPPDNGKLLLELLSEEIPARVQLRAIADLCALLADKLAATDLAAESIRGYVTPRRLAVIAHGIPATQPDRSEERRGPRVGAAAAAVGGFLRAAGLGSVGECEIRDTGRGEFYFAVLRRPGRPAAAVLSELVTSAIGELAWPKSMRWPGAPVRWVRPLRSILCLFNGQIVPLALDGVPVGRTTRGHRFLAPNEICVADAAEYLERLQQAHVMADHRRRQEAIVAGLERRAAELGVVVKPDPQLLDEVTGLVEFPVVLAGAIDADFMSLPHEVLATAMRAHQKYFSCVEADGSAAPHFLFTADNLADDGGKAIVAGNERVLRARLADARFFWDQDRKLRLADRVEALKERVYHDRLGSLFDKAERMALLAEFVAERVPGADRQRSQRSACLAKADLSTGMVGEFPELQGIMGRYYALHDGEDPSVAEAIADHYRPLGPHDACPTRPDSVVIALVDKLDALFAFARINERPTGSRDPFALRRAAQGVIRLILENGLRLPLVETFAHLHKIFTDHHIESAQTTENGRSQGAGSSVYDVASELLEFIIDRLKAHLRERGERHDLIAAAFAPSGEREDDLVRLLERVEALKRFLDTEDGTNLLTAYRRAANIVAIEEARDGRAYDSPIDSTRLEQAEERLLAKCLDEVGTPTENLLREERFAEAMAELARLRRPVDEFFDKVTVNTTEAILRANRLRLLSRIRATMNRIADFSQIEG
jgi:glycyl-tRNA synthetase beta chain